jgi:hypothetical protein
MSMIEASYGRRMIQLGKGGEELAVTPPKEAVAARAAYRIDPSKALPLAC